MRTTLAASLVNSVLGNKSVTNFKRVDCCNCSAETKLLFLVRHGQAWSNYLEEVLGPDLWYGVVSKCGFTTGNGTDYQIFDAGEVTYSSCCIRQLMAFIRLPAFEVKLKCFAPPYTTQVCITSELTDAGQAQAEDLHTMLASNSSFHTVTGGLPTRAIVSPLSRCTSCSTPLIACLLAPESRPRTTHSWNEEVLLSGSA